MALVALVMVHRNMVLTVSMTGGYLELQFIVPLGLLFVPLLI